jgi:predicted kinase
MRKWMRERIQRRKKKAEQQASEPAPPPLQPAYFDEAPSPVAESTAREVERDTSREAEPEAAASETRASARESPAADVPQKSGGSRRGRRRRGGRGRGGRGRERAVAQAFAPAAGKGTIPEVPAGEAPAETSSRELAEEAAPESDAEAATPLAVTPVVEAPKLPAVPAAQARPPKGIVVLAIGLPGSGKSSWFKRHNVAPLSSDMMRTLLFDDVREQRYQDLVFSNLRSMLKARLIAKRPMNYVDATNLTPQERQHWITLAKDYNYEVHAVFFDVPLEVCIERHQRRDRVVPEDVMRRMAAKLKPPSFNEGFAKITVVRVKKKEAAPADQ